LEYIYLDWNVIQGMKRKENKELIEVLKRIKNKYNFPISIAHMEDLARTKGTKEKTRSEFIEEDIEYAENLSGFNVIDIDYKIINYQLERLLEDVELNAKNNLSEDVEFDFNSFGDNEFSIDIENVSKSNPLFNLIKENNNILDSRVLDKLFSDIYNNIDNPTYIKNFRDEAVKTKDNFKRNKDTVLNQNSEFFNGLISFIDFMKDDKMDSIERNFEKTLKSFLSISNKTIEKTDKRDLIQIIYAILDFNPKFREKINKKNKPSNQTRDLNHFHFAIKSKYYITQDGPHAKKSNFISNYLNFNVNALTIEEFLKKKLQ